MGPAAIRHPAAVALAVVLVLGTGACAGNGGNGADRSARATESTRRSARPTTTPATRRADPHPEVAVERAYLKSWDDYAHAAWTLDPRGLDRTYADDALAWVEDDIAQRVRDHRKSRVSVTHDVTVTMLADDRAAVVDRVVSSSVAVDAETGADLEGPHADPEYYQMVLERYGHSWKVMFVA